MGDIFVDEVTVFNVFLLPFLNYIILQLPTNPIFGRKTSTKNFFKLTKLISRALTEQYKDHILTKNF